MFSLIYCRIFFSGTWSMNWEQVIRVICGFILKNRILLKLNLLHVQISYSLEFQINVSAFQFWSTSSEYYKKLTQMQICPLPCHLAATIVNWKFWVGVFLKTSMNILLRRGINKTQPSYNCLQNLEAVGRKMKDDRCAWLLLSFLLFSLKDCVNSDSVFPIFFSYYGDFKLQLVKEVRYLIYKALLWISNIK